MKSLKIGGIKLRNPLLLAPMVDVTDMAYRVLCRRAGASMAYTEMIHVQSIIHMNKSVRMKMLSNQEDKPLGIQITGSEVKDFSKVVPNLKNFDLVDLNCGCPGSLTIDNLSGAYLMKNPDKIASIVKLLKDEELTVTAKIRLGFSKNNVLELAKKIESAGADALTVHARLGKDGRDIKADWKWFSKIKEKIGIPLIGNGDIFKPQDAEKILDVCDGVMIARGAIGNPLIFRDTLKYLKTGKEGEFDCRENTRLFLDYFNIAEKYSLLSMPKVKYIGGKFIRGFEGAPEKRNEFMKLKKYEDLKSFFKKLNF